MKDKKILNTSQDTSNFDMDSLKQELEVENNFLIKLVDTIPAKMYFEHGIQEKITAERHSTMDKAAEEIKRLSCNHIELSAKGKHKRAKLDPLNQKSVSQIHNELNKKKKRKNKKQKGMHVSSDALTRAANIEELQKRLQDRIKLFQDKRKAAATDPKTKRQLKTKVKKLKQRGNLLKAKEQVKIEKTPQKKKEDKTPEKPVFNKDGNFIYSKFEFNEDGEVESKKKDEYSGKNLKALLKKAEKKKEKIESLMVENPEKAESIVEKEKWKKAILKSEGVKVKDDPELLKKSLKSEEKKKKRSAKVWKERSEDVEKRKKARQDKRSKNIKLKKKEKLDRKLKLAKKKGRVIPGF